MPRLFDWLNDPQRQAKIIGARLNAEFDQLVVGPATSDDEAAARFNGDNSMAIEGSDFFIRDNGNFDVAFDGDGNNFLFEQRNENTTGGTGDFIRHIWSAGDSELKLFVSHSDSEAQYDLTGTRLTFLATDDGAEIAFVTAETTGGDTVIQAGNNDRLRVDVDGNVVCNEADIATNATDGFLYVPTCAGPPTGTPTTYAGRAPIVIDATNNKLYFYSTGAWRDAGP